MLTYLFQVGYSVGHSSLDFLGVGGVDPIQKGSQSGELIRKLETVNVELGRFSAYLRVLIRRANESTAARIEQAC
jgi:hypothetical protein